MSIAQNFPNIKPSLMLSFADTKQLDNRVTFTRSTPAVYYDGRTTTMAEQNLLTYSQDFSNAVWSVDNVTKGSATNTAPDGTSTATLIYPSATGSYAYFVQLLNATQGKIATFSVYMKAQNKTVGWLYHYNGSQYGTYYVNLSTGATQIVAGSTATGTMTATSVGNGWYRVSVTYPFTYNGEANWGIGLSDSMGSVPVTANGTDGIYIWGAQVEQRSSATAYTATTTQPITNYIPVLLTAGGNQPRFDCNPTTGESLGLLIEEQRTNIATYSSVNTSGWVSVSSTLTNNYATSPDGTTSAGYLADDTNNVQHSLYQTVTLANATSYSFSAYIKSYGRNYAEIIPFGTPTGNTVVGASFNLSNGTVSATTGAVTATITSVGNGWYRCSVIYTTVASGALNFNIFPSIGPNVGDRVYTGNGFSGLLVWGAQTEVGAFATSYIATTSASATRTADSASMTGTNFSSWYRADSATLYVDTTWLTNSATGNQRIILMASPDDLYAIQIARNVYANGVIAYRRGASGEIEVVTGIKTAKTAFSWDLTLIALSANASAVSSLSYTMAYRAVDTMYIGFNSRDNTGYNGTIKKIAFYPLASTSTQLQALTS